MAFCPYCGKQTADGEVCSCTIGSAAPRFDSAPAEEPIYRPVAQPQQERPEGAYPAPPAAPQQPAYAPRPSEPVRQPGGYAPQSGGYAPQQGGYAPQQGGYAPRQGEFTDPRGGYAPRRPEGYGEAFPEEEAYAPRTDARRPAAPAKQSAFVDDLKEMLGRITKLFTGKSDEALRESLDSESTGWMVVFAAYVIFGTLAACFAVPRFIADLAKDLLGDLLGGFINYGDVLSQSFGGMLWRSLLVNIFALGIILAAVVIIGKVKKTEVPFAGVLNLVGMAFVPAAALNVLGFLFSFFFPVGTLLCGIVSAVCTIVIILSALADRSGKHGLWVSVIAVCAILVVYILLTWLLMSGAVKDMFAAPQPDFGDFGDLEDFSSWF